MCPPLDAEYSLSLASPLYTLVALTPAVLALATAPCNTYGEVDPYPLRSLDAVQVATAQVAAAATHGPFFFAAADTRLLTIAETEGFAVINPLTATLPFV